MQYFVYTTCGTSTFTNPARKNTELHDLIIKNSNVRDESELETEAKEKINAHYESLIEEWQNYSVAEARKRSAELNCLLCWQEKNNIPTSDCFCYLLHTDTVLGGYAASLVEEWLKTNGYTVLPPERVPYLSTSSHDAFEKGLASLAEWTFGYIPAADQRTATVKYIFNVAGGFKAVSGFMQILGQFLADETIYLFEGRNEILSVPKLPVRWEQIDTIRDNIDDYRRVSIGLPPQNPEKLNSLWVREGSFTPWGQIAWENAKQELYQEKVYGFVCDLVKEGDKFRKSVDGLDGLRNKIVNERIDDLCLFFMSGKKKNIRRLDYKSVKGNYPWSNECDAWADGAARRLFCNEKDGYVVVECLGDALH